MDVDVLVTGHTHAFEAYEYQKKFFINPGSATGSFSSVTEQVLKRFLLNVLSDIIPTFVLMDVQGAKIITYVYQLRDGEVKVDKMEYLKPE